MLFNSVAYLLFLIIVTVVYYLFPHRFRYLWLLAASYFFYAQWNPAYLFLLFGCTVVVYFSALIIEKVTAKDPRLPKITVAVCICICLGILCYYKYTYLFLEMIGKITSFLPSGPLDLFHGINILLPVGISFFTLQALGYLIDVYRREIAAERNFFRFALFISFFPQLVAGPIERSKNLLHQLSEPHRFSLDNLRKGLLIIGYGLFLKMVIADRAAVIVDTVFDHVADYPGLYVVIGALFFAVQIYCDFYGYSVIAKGSALLLGIHLMDNFNAPYYSKSIRELWTRWHISLSTWFRDYLYIPLGGNRKGESRRQLNRLIVFAVSGLWHGAALSFVLWGILNAVYQMLEDLWKRIRKHLPAQSGSTKVTFSKQLFSMIVTFTLFDFAWILFRAGGTRPAVLVLKSMLSTFNPTIFLNGSIFALGVDKNYFLILMLSILVLAIVDRFKYKGADVVAWFFDQGPLFRLILETALIFTIVLFGCYGELYDVQQFIYFQF